MSTNKGKLIPIHWGNRVGLIGPNSRPLKDVEPCPFCACLDFKLIGEKGRFKHWWLECQICLACGPGEYSVEAAVDTWNTRSSRDKK